MHLFSLWTESRRVQHVHPKPQQQGHRVHPNKIINKMREGAALSFREGSSKPSLNPPCIPPLKSWPVGKERPASREASLDALAGRLFPGREPHLCGGGDLHAPQSWYWPHRQPWDVSEGLRPSPADLGRNLNRPFPSNHNRSKNILAGVPRGAAMSPPWSRPQNRLQGAGLRLRGAARLVAHIKGSGCRLIDCGCSLDASAALSP